jgi:hypothetical protein
MDVAEVIISEVYCERGPRFSRFLEKALVSLVNGTIWLFRLAHQLNSVAVFSYPLKAVPKIVPTSRMQGNAKRYATYS